MKSWILIISLIATATAWAVHKGPILGPARGHWNSREEIVFKTPLALRTQQDFYLKTSQDSVLLKVKKNDWGRVTLSVPQLSKSKIEKLLRSDLQLVVIN